MTTFKCRVAIALNIEAESEQTARDFLDLQWLRTDQANSVEIINVSTDEVTSV